METAIIAFVALAALLMAAILVPPARRERVREGLRAAWGRTDGGRTLDEELVRDEAAGWRDIAATVAPEDTVDDVTWEDLDMDAVFCRVDRSTSVVGSEALYAMLRQTGVDAETLARRMALAEALCTDEEARLDVQQAALMIGRRHFHGALDFLRNAQADFPGPGYMLLAAVPVLCLLAGPFYPPLFLGIVFSFCVNLIVHYRAEVVWARQINAVTHISTVLAAANRLARSGAAAIAPEVQGLRALCAKLRGLRAFSRLCGETDDGRGDPLSLIREYLKIAFLVNLVGLRRAGVEIARHASEVRRLYAHVGELDALVGVAALRACGQVCFPAFEAERGVRFAALVHPLVENAVPNDGAWTRNTLVTGSNASGKSTFLKALAVNAILAQTIGVCFAQEFRIGRARVMSSMAVRDSVRGGESYFVAEIRSLKRILDAAEGKTPVLAFVDEILRGTNTIERIAASAAVLDALTGKNILVMAATHDIELTRMLAGYQNIHFREWVDQGGVTFDYKLRPGPSRTRNALELLGQMGFDRETVDHAREMAARFERGQGWDVLEERQT